jgi:hypothetical protein
MKKAVLGLMALGMLGLAESPAFAQRGLAPADAFRNGWLGDYRQARELAARTGKPIMLYFRCVP